MAEQIKVNCGVLSSTFIDEAKSCVSGAKSLANVSNVTYACNGSQLTVYSEDVMSQLKSARNTLNSINTKLDSYSRIITSGPDDIAEIDQSAKGQITSWLSRFKYKAGNAFSKIPVVISIKVKLISAITVLHTFLNNLFTDKKNKTGTVTDIDEDADSSAVKQPKAEDYEDMLDDYDWNQTDTNRDEAEKVIIAAIASVPAGQDARDYIKEQLDAYYNRHSIGMLTTSPSHNEYYSIDGCEKYIRKQPYSGPCMAYSYYMGKCIIEGQDNGDPMTYWNGEQAYNMSDLDYSNCWQDLSAVDILEQLKTGKPVLIHMEHSGSGGEHWVTVCGTKNLDVSSVTINDFLFLDPGYGTVSTYDDLASHYSNINPDKMDFYK